MDPRPFSADIADGCIWGRGTTDCKCVMLSELEAVESLFTEGFAPDYDIYLAFGHNEEITAQKENKGAFLIARELERRGITLGCVFDEGGSVTHIHTGQFEGYAAKIAMAEKGFNDYEIFHDCAGGHSSRPGQGSALGAVARGIVMLEENPFPYRLTPLTKMQLSAMSSYMEEPGKTVFADPLHHEKELIEMARQIPNWMHSSIPPWPSPCIRKPAVQCHAFPCLSHSQLPAAAGRHFGIRTRLHPQPYSK